MLVDLTIDTIETPIVMQESLLGGEVPVITKRKVGRPKGSTKKKIQPDNEPVTEPQRITLKEKLNYMDDQIDKMSKHEAWAIIRQYKALQTTV